eukprot:CAMPEP_0183332096 /NCGR_PEP_ID=MMETSP0164_2-20130417/1340_1 /TAXON_ID=221442 /ORGANISM="Coccolithus pelagicus ssp braarudi, Strain PLY182g" /LENGTH=362 /DNA_ID=CAMNT_0025500735 /DNA_START=57 /DNA_END=1145 /DNA_ORIENTATION=-
MYSPQAYHPHGQVPMRVFMTPNGQMMVAAHPFTSSEPTQGPAHQNYPMPTRHTVKASVVQAKEVMAAKMPPTHFTGARVAVVRPQDVVQARADSPSTAPCSTAKSPVSRMDGVDPLEVAGDVAAIAGQLLMLKHDAFAASASASAATSVDDDVQSVGDRHDCSSDSSHARPLSTPTSTRNHRYARVSRQGRRIKKARKARKPQRAVDGVSVDEFDTASFHTPTPLPPPPAQKNLNQNVERGADGLFPCQYPGCNTRFSTRFSLKRHSKRHTGYRPFVCQFDSCGRAFAERSTLKRHMRTHTGERPYRCKYQGCGKRFADRTNIRRHMETHDKASVYACPGHGCKRTFTRRSMLDKHLDADHV